MGVVWRWLPREVVVVAVAAMVLLGGSALAILWLQVASDRHQRGIQALGGVALATAELNQLQWRAAAEHGVSGELAMRIRETRGAARASLARTLAELGRPGDLPAVERLFTRYLASTASEVSLLAQGKLAAAKLVNEESTDPIFGRLRLRIAAEQASERIEARRAAWIARTGRILVLFLSLIAIAALCWRLASTKRAAREAFFDPLTGLANRMLVSDRLTQALRLAERAGKRVAVLFLDVDNFKRVNDTLGHAAGDALLRAVAERLLTAVRVSDTVGRLGGDEFAIVLQGGVEEIDAPAVAARVLDRFAVPFTVAGHQVTMTTSIGFVVSDGEGTPADELLRSADLAMYAGKRQGKRCAVMYEPSMYEALSDRLQLETDLRDALGRNEIAVAYQPIVELDTGRPCSMEALARWTHPLRGVIAPALFIPVAEEAGMIHELGRFVLLTATQQLRRWQADGSSLPPLGINVNVSPFQLQDGRVVDDVRDALQESGIDPRTLTLEITESVLVDRGDNFADTLQQLSELGVRLAVDDFGTGHSSLSSLRRLPIDTLKVDRSFVDTMGDEESGFELVRSIVELGGRLGLDVVAEGIERSDQAALLRQLNCTFGQGYHYARPLTSDAAAEYLAEQAAPPAADARPRRGSDPAAPWSPAPQPG